MFSSVGDLVDEATEEFEDRRLSEKALSHIAYLSFPPVGLYFNICNSNKLQTLFSGTRCLEGTTGF